MTQLRIILVAGIVLLGCQAKQGPALPPAEGKGAPPPAAIPTLDQLAAEHPEAAAVQSAPVGTGTLKPRHFSALGPKETGLITHIAVDEGDSVKKGQLLFRLDSAQADLAVQQAKAAVATVQVQLDAAQLEYNRTKALRERGSVPPDALDQAKAHLDATVTGLDQARAALGLAERRASNMVLTAPFDGVITEKRMNVGETATLMPPSVVLVLQDIDSLELRARLPETALQRVHVGSEISARFPSIGEERQLRVDRIGPTVDARTRTIEIVCNVDNRDHRLLAGMLAEVRYGGNGREEASAAPVQAPPAQADNGGSGGSR